MNLVLLPRSLRTNFARAIHTFCECECLGLSGTRGTCSACAERAPQLTRLMNEEGCRNDPYHNILGILKDIHDERLDPVFKPLLAKVV